MDSPAPDSTESLQKALDWELLESLEFWGWKYDIFLALCFGVWCFSHNILNWFKCIPYINLLSPVLGWKIGVNEILIFFPTLLQLYLPLCIARLFPPTPISCIIIFHPPLLNFPTSANNSSPFFILFSPGRLSVFFRSFCFLPISRLFSGRSAPPLASFFLPMWIFPQRSVCKICKLRLFSASFQ